jgi:hypothetical protein
MSAIAEKVDWLIATHVPQGHDACAAVDPPPPTFVMTMQGVRNKKANIPIAKRPQQQAHKSQGCCLDLNRCGVDKASGLKLPCASTRQPYSFPRQPYSFPRQPYSFPRQPYSFPRQPYSFPCQP